MAARFSIRTWRKNYQKTTPTKTRRQISTQIEQTLASGEGISTNNLISCLRNLSCFKGVIPQDYLDKIILESKMCFVVNVDFSTQPGSHWIAIHIEDLKCFIIDSLGLKFMKLEQGSKPLFRFISRLSKKLRIYKTSLIQNPISPFCGFYCILFLLSLSFTCFRDINSLFNTNLRSNDSLLLYLLK